MSRLLLREKVGTKINIGNDITITIIKAKSKWANLLIDAPRELKIEKIIEEREIQIPCDVCTLLGADTNI